MECAAAGGCLPCPVRSPPTVYTPEPPADRLPEPPIAGMKPREICKFLEDTDFSLFAWILDEKAPHELS